MFWFLTESKSNTPTPKKNKKQKQKTTIDVRRNLQLYLQSWVLMGQWKLFPGLVLKDKENVPIEEKLSLSLNTTIHI